ncbi:MAG: ABC transporter permease [Terriglobales bacterium]
MHSFLHDLRYAVRLLLKSPGFAVVAIVTLALGIGATTTMFSVIDAVLLESAPVRNPQRLVMVWENKFNGSSTNKTNVVGPANYIRWTEQNHSFDDMGAFISFGMNVSVNGQSERVQAGIATPSLFSTLGTRAALGRVFLPEEQEPGKDNVALLSYSYWQQRFGGDPSVIGKDVVLNGNPDKIVGVLPPNFDLFEKVNIWTTLTIRPATRNSAGRYLTVIGRLKPGVTVTQAQADMDVVSAHTRVELADWDAGWGVTLVPFREQLVGSLKNALYVLFGAVAFVLLIACANVANLMMAKASARHKEIAIRTALGISRSRLVRQLLTESTVLSLAGGLLGVLLAYWAIAAVVAMAPAAFPAYVDIRLNLPVLAFTFAVAVITGILFGLVPALRASRTDPQDALKEGGKGSPAHGRQRLRNALVVLEAATALILLIGAGILMRSFVRLMNVDTGFRSEGVLTMEVSLSGDSYRKDASVSQYFQEAVARVQRVPGVTAAGAISWLPLVGMGSATAFTVDDRPAPKPGDEPVADVRTITADYFRAMGIAVLRGRTFVPSQDHPDDAIKKIVVNQATADLYWPGQDPIGKTIHMPWGKTLQAEVVGVVSDIRSAKIEAKSRKPMLYWYVPQFANSFMTIVARTNGDPKLLVASVKSEIESVDHTIPVANIRTMDDVVGSAIREPRFTAVLLGIFAGLALLLAAIGLYGVLSYSVTQRHHELGIRMALGARPGSVATMILREGLALTLGGTAIGFVAALVLVRFLSTLVFGVSTHDALVFGTVPALVAVVAALACYIPARRATRVDPMVALRYE